ncbi:MAG: hypothetical protein A2289_21105 [Deltaproteobacteria bacterium RIFOXYA12_FULL_58_15]|nr:MAG: hypothetical protein A2289_21105 [Deltaproteobacteria bacterium RIFOXYA12_FULL_58_15]
MAGEKIPEGGVEKVSLGWKSHLSSDMMVGGAIKAPIPKTSLNIYGSFYSGVDCRQFDKVNFVGEMQLGAAFNTKNDRFGFRAGAAGRFEPSLANDPGYGVGPVVGADIQTSEASDTRVGIEGMRVNGKNFVGVTVTVNPSKIFSKK